MSYDIYVCRKDNDDTVYLKNLHNMGGGTQAVGGTDRAWLNVTYNYAPLFRECFGEGGIHFIENQSVKETLPVLQKGIEYLERTYPITEIPKHVDYWEPTPLNVKKALVDLVNIAKLTLTDYPDEDFVWRIH